MPIHDNFSNQVVVCSHIPVLVSSNTTTTGEIIDTADYGMGIKFCVIVSMYNDGDYALSFEDGDDPGLSDASLISSEKIIGDAVSLSTETGLTDPWPGNGLFSTKRYVRAVITSTNVTGAPGLVITVTAVLSGEYNPQVQ